MFRGSFSRAEAVKTLGFYYQFICLKVARRNSEHNARRAKDFGRRPLERGHGQARGCP
jgi:hypothetical protein